MMPSSENTVHRFVVQEHTSAKGVHWDLMLERDEALMTFRLEEAPEATASGPVPAEPIFDHPLRFLTYEGPVQEGCGRVRIVDRGNYRIRRQSDELILLRMDGAVLNGDFTLRRTHAAAWQFAPSRS